MSQEIERKFLVAGEYKSLATMSCRMMQGYISKKSGHTVRVRIAGDKAFLTIKGASTSNGLSRYEWEKEISTSDAKELMQLCEGIIIDKTRYYVPFGNHTFEVDEFHGKHEGLVIAEIELQTEDETYTKPPFLGEEVTGDRRYYNSVLADPAPNV
jgi:CYTH domain-containing protein